MLPARHAQLVRVALIGFAYVIGVAAAAANVPAWLLGLPVLATVFVLVMAR